jgi:PAS domain S-box-containing protein
LSKDFLNSFALIDTNGRLVYWDEGFAREFRLAAPLLKSGTSYAEIARAASEQPGVKEFMLANSEFRDLDSLLEDGLTGFGEDRSGEYHTPEGRIIRVDQHRMASGDIRRFARDVTDEIDAEKKTMGTYRRLDAPDVGFGTVLTETRRTPNGNYFFQAIDEGLQRLLDLSPDFVEQSAIMFYARMIASAEDHARYAAQLEEAALMMKNLEQDYHLLDGKDRPRWVRHSMLPRRESDGTVVFSGVMRDVTREKEAEDQVEMLRSVVVESSDSIVIFESDSIADEGHIVYVNPKFTELFGWSVDELMDKQWDFMADRPVVARKRIAEARLRNDGEPVELETSSRSGRVFWAEARVVTIQRFDHDRSRWAVIGRDISERRRGQQELLRATQEAKEANRAKSEFLANMSHELRTPLNAVIGFTDLIKQGVARTGWSPSYLEYLDDVAESGLHLLDLINTILDLSRIGAGQLELDIAPVDLSELIRTSVGLMSGIARTNGIMFSIDIPPESPEIVGDFLKLKQVLLNIISNAIKFTPNGGSVSVALNFTETTAEILVADTGCGIAEEDLGRVMLPFVQAASSFTRKFQGSGLGLPIAHELCKLHGGSLEIESTEGKGTAVRISLPR